MRDRLHLQRGGQGSSIKLAQPDIDFPHLISEYLVSSIKYHEEVVYADVPAPDRLRRESDGAVTQPPSSGRLEDVLLQEARCCKFAATCKYSP